MKRSCKILSGSPLHPIPLLTCGNENLRSGQRTKEGTRLGRASLIKAQKYIFELGETADKKEKKRRRDRTQTETEMRKGGENRVFYPATRGYLFGKQTDRQMDRQ